MTRYLPDVNVWFALMQIRHQHHGTAQNWMQSIAGPDRICFCRPTQQGIFRLSTTNAVMQQYGVGPVPNTTAWHNCERWLTDPLITFEHEPMGLDPIWKKLAAVRTASPKLWMDAYLAAFAMAGGYSLVTTDQAFKQFKGLDLAVLG
jgi:toxin-antitoxin system PIN domain toxin